MEEHMPCTPSPQVEEEGEGEGETSEDESGEGLGMSRTCARCGKSCAKVHVMFLKSLSLVWKGSSYAPGLAIT